MKTCHSCGSEYERIGSHWSRGSCDYPSFTDRQREIITGALMGDGYISSQEGRKPYLDVCMINDKCLEWIDSEMGIFGNGFVLDKTAEELIEHNKKYDYVDVTNESEYNDIYRWRSMCHPELREFEAWYDTGTKVWPKSIEFTPLTLKVFYCCDGNFDDSGSHRYVRFGVSNEREYKDKVDELFGVFDLSGRWYEYERKDGSINTQYILNVEQSQKCFEIMGDPLPGFEYKWPEHLR